MGLTSPSSPYPNDRALPIRAAQQGSAANLSFPPLLFWYSHNPSPIIQRTHREHSCIYVHTHKHTQCVMCMHINIPALPSSLSKKNPKKKHVFMSLSSTRSAPMRDKHQSLLFKASQTHETWERARDPETMRERETCSDLLLRCWDGTEDTPLIPDSYPVSYISFMFHFMLHSLDHLFTVYPHSIVGFY